MKTAVSIIFSKDRALQLRAMLESFQTNFLDAGEFVDLCVLYKASNEIYDRQYEQLRKEFPTVVFIKEFYLVEQIKDILSLYKYIFFQVDDNITTSPCFVMDAISCLENPHVLGFSYRLGKNTNYCYMLRSEQKIPVFSPEGVKNCYNWTEAEFDFGYPLEVSSSIYRSEDILPYMTDKNVPCLVMVEGTLNQHRNDFAVSKPYLCCYEYSRMFSLPLNNVSFHPENRAGELQYYLIEELAKLFDENKRIKVEDLYGIQTNSCHQEFPIFFENKV